MSKKELLIILILAVLVILAPRVFCAAPICHGIPLRVWFEVCKPRAFGGCRDVLRIQPFILDAIFWFVVLAAGWWGIQKLKRKS